MCIFGQIRHALFILAVALAAVLSSAAARIGAMAQEDPTIGSAPRGLATAIERRNRLIAGAAGPGARIQPQIASGADVPGLLLRDRRYRSWLAQKRPLTTVRIAPDRGGRGTRFQVAQHRRKPPRRRAPIRRCSFTSSTAARSYARVSPYGVTWF